MLKIHRILSGFVDVVLLREEESIECFGIRALWREGWGMRRLVCDK